jgi:hypothetical protein
MIANFKYDDILDMVITIPDPTKENSFGTLWSLSGHFPRGRSGSLDSSSEI